MPLWAWALAGGMLGLIAGSFLATLVLRWPRGESIVAGGSACEQCGKRLAASELVPLASWLWIRGRCRRCGGRIDPLHPAIEGLCALVGASAFLVAPGISGLMGASFGWVLVALAALDLRHFWLPDRLVLALLLISAISWWLGLAPPPTDRLFGALGGYAALALVATTYRLVRNRDGLGAGDAKLFGALGAMLGWQTLPLILVGACGVGLVFIATRFATGQKVAATDRLPLGALLALVAFPAWIFQQKLALGQRPGHIALQLETRISGAENGDHQGPDACGREGTTGCFYCRTAGVGSRAQGSSQTCCRNAG